MASPTRASIPLLGKRNPRVLEVHRIVRHGPPGTAVADGPKLVLDLIAAGVKPEVVLLSPARLPLLERSASLAALAAAGLVFAVAEEVMERIAPSRHPQGVLAVFGVTPRPLPAGEGIVLYLDRVQDPSNVGAVVRCAAALGAAGVACSPGCADPFSPRAVRASAGQSLLFPVVGEADFGALAAATRARRGQVVGLAGKGGTPVPWWPASRSLLLALGNEGSGLAPGILAACDAVLTIPLHRGVESLNVAVAAGVALAVLGGLAPSPILD